MTLAGWSSRLSVDVSLIAVHFNARRAPATGEWCYLSKEGTMSRVGSTLANLLTQLPLYLIWIVGIILAITSWQKHRRASLFTLIGLGILLLQALTGALLTPAFVRFLHVGGMGGR
jgi:hypothetical protein